MLGFPGASSARCCCFFFGGLGRTGTNSLQKALELLGFDPCFHGYRITPVFGSRLQADQGTSLAELPFWVDALQKKAEGRSHEIDLKGHWAKFPFKATQDSPYMHFRDEIAAAFPRTKFILTVRDPERWYESFRRTVLPMLIEWRLRLTTRFHPDAFKFTNIMWRCQEPYLPLTEPNNKKLWVQAYHAHSELIKATMPADRLLVFDVRDGWAPLCAFLSVPVPDVPFPNQNDTTLFQTGLRRASQVVDAVLLLLGLLLAYLLHSQLAIANPAYSLPLDVLAVLVVGCSAIPALFLPYY
eukprot:m.463694 g.463694  ORF g.463694 m.463694 type:complete len:298 (-) comp57038_c0_seq8:161-1054(-)